MKFSNGDRVKVAVLHCCDSDRFLGRVGTVVYVDPRVDEGMIGVIGICFDENVRGISCCIRCAFNDRCRYEYGNGWYFESNQLELVGHGIDSVPCCLAQKQPDKLH